MNPLLIFFFLYLLSSEKNSQGSFDTFKMELALDNMNRAVDMVQRMNSLGKTAMSFHSIPPLPPPPGSAHADPFSNGAPPPRPAPAPTPDLNELMSSMGPILQMLAKGGKQ